MIPMRMTMNRRDASAGWRLNAPLMAAWMWMMKMPVCCSFDKMICDSFIMKLVKIMKHTALEYLEYLPYQ